jgi:FlaA1/EpsC-like NDP-sugar epimerase
MSIRYSKYLPGFIFITDLLLLNLAINIANYIQFGTYHTTQYSGFILILINFSWVFVSALSGSYKVKRPLSLKDNLNRFILTLIYHLLILFSIFYFFKLFDFSRLLTLVGYFLFFAFILVHRSFVFFSLDYIRKKGYNHRQIVIIGDENISKRLLASFAHHPEYGYESG